MNLDEHLLSKSGEEAAGRVGRLIESRRRLVDGRKTLLDGKKSLLDGKKTLIQQREEERAQSPREAVIAARREKAAKEKGDGKERLMAAVATPFRKTMSRLLRQAWFNLIDSCGATFIWVNIHVFLSVVLGNKFFCKLGHEWADISSREANNPKLEAAKRRAGIVEKMGVGFVDAVLLFLIISILGIFAMILAVVANPLDNLDSLASFAWAWVTGSGITGK